MYTLMFVLIILTEVPTVLKNFPCTTTTCSNKIIHLWHVHAWKKMRNLGILFPGNCAFGGKYLQFWGEIDGYFGLFLPTNSKHLWKIHIFDAIFDHIPGKFRIFSSHGHVTTKGALYWPGLIWDIEQISSEDIKKRIKIIIYIRLFGEAINLCI